MADGGAAPGIGASCWCFLSSLLLRLPALIVYDKDRLVSIDAVGCKERFGWKQRTLLSISPGLQQP
jgi:hypothetical protein